MPGSDAREREQPSEPATPSIAQLFLPELIAVVVQVFVIALFMVAMGLRC